jgi:hypothetical protein
MILTYLQPQIGNHQPAAKLVLWNFLPNKPRDYRVANHKYVSVPRSQKENNDVAGMIFDRQYFSPNK